jgi:hypothetical protein
MTLYACNIKYTPPDITLPVPTPLPLLWRSTSFVSHALRVRITFRPTTTDAVSALAKTGRIKYVGLSARDKLEFLKVWRR